MARVGLACAAAFAVHRSLNTDAAGDAFLVPRAVTPLEGVTVTSSASQRQRQATKSTIADGAVGTVAAALVTAAAAAGIRRGAQVARKAQWAQSGDTFVQTGTMSSPQALPPGTKQGKHTLVQNKVIPSGPVEPIMSDEEAEVFMNKRVAALSELMPQNDEEFEDDMEERRWLWARELLPNSARCKAEKIGNRQQMAAHKSRTVMKQSSFFRKLRLFQPLAMKYPTMLKKLILRDIQDIECKDMVLNAHWFHNEEKIAGFTYEDWTKTTNGDKFDEWKQPEVDDLITGVVAAMNQEGAFIEIGGKTWAFLPLAEISLSAIGTPSEVLSMGQEIQVRITDADVKSMVYGETVAKQFVVSMTGLLKEQAWDEIEDIMAGKEGTSPLMEVNVIEVRPFGAIVKTDSGLEGFIPNSDLADKAGETGLAGTKIIVELKSAQRETIDARPGQGERQKLTFSYKNAATKELCMKLNEGDVVEARVVGIRETALDVNVLGTQVEVRKVDISAVTQFDLQDIFDLDDDIKLAVISTEEKSGAIRLSLRALEAKRGMVTQPGGLEKVLAKAERTAKKYFAVMQKEKQRFEDTLDGNTAAGGGLDGDDEADQDVF